MISDPIGNIDPNQASPTLPDEQPEGNNPFDENTELDLTFQQDAEPGGGGSTDDVVGTDTNLEQGGDHGLKRKSPADEEDTFDDLDLDILEAKKKARSDSLRKSLSAIGTTGHRCPVCDDTFGVLWQLEAHRRAQHRDLTVYRFQCTYPNCRHKFRNEDEAEKHIWWEHRSKSTRFYIPYRHVL